MTEVLSGDKTPRSEMVSTYQEQVVAVQVSFRNLSSVMEWLRELGEEFAGSEPVDTVAFLIWRGGYCLTVRFGDWVVKSRHGVEVFSAEKFPMLFSSTD